MIISWVQALGGKNAHFATLRFQVQSYCAAPWSTAFHYNSRPTNCCGVSLEERNRLDARQTYVCVVLYLFSPHSMIAIVSLNVSP